MWHGADVYDVTLNLYDGKNRLEHTVKIDMENVTAGNINSIRGINIIDELDSIAGDHQVTTYAYVRNPDDNDP